MLRIKSFLTLSLVVAILSSCGVSQQDKEEIATITCNVIKSTRNMDAAFRIKEINLAREQMGEERFLGTDDGILHAIEHDLCELLVMNDSAYYVKLNEIFEQERLEREEKRIAAEKERLEQERIAAEQRQKVEDDRDLIRNRYGSDEELKQNIPWYKIFVIESIFSRSVNIYGETIPAKAFLKLRDKTSIFVSENDVIQRDKPSYLCLTDRKFMRLYTPDDRENESCERILIDVKIVYISSLTDSIVFQDMRNNNYFLISTKSFDIGVW
jgi:hypothetical protein